MPQHIQTSDTIPASDLGGTYSAPTLQNTANVRAIISAASSSTNAITTLQTKTASFTAVAGYKYKVDATSGAITATLPSTNTIGQQIVIQKSDTSTNLVTTSGTIDTVASTTNSVRTQNQGKLYVGDGTGNWFVLAGDVSVSVLDTRYDAAGAAAARQATLVSGTNIKTVNGTSLLGSGNIVTTYTPTDASTTAKGIVQLAGDLAGTATAPTVPALANKANTASPTFTGTVTVPAPVNATDASTKGYVDTAITNAASTYDDVKDYASLSNFPATGVADVLYMANDTNYVYRWGGSSYIQVGGGNPSDATTTSKGVVQLAGDLAGTAAAPTVPGLTNKQIYPTQQATQTASFTAVGNSYYPVNASSGNVTVTLPTSTAGQAIYVKKLDANAATGATSGIVTLSGTINGTASTTLPLRKINQAKRLNADGSGGWTVVNGDLDITSLYATSSEPGTVQLAGDLGGTPQSPTTPTAVHITGNETVAGTKNFTSQAKFTEYLLTGGGTNNSRIYQRIDGRATFTPDNVNNTSNFFEVSNLPDLTFEMQSSTAMVNFQTYQAALTVKSVGSYPLNLYSGNQIVNTNNSRITSIMDPTSAQDAATKNYVDTLNATKQPNLVTQSVQTANFTASSGKLYPVNASSAAITVTLPTSTASQIITIIKNDSSTNFVNVTGTINGISSTTINFKLFNEEKTFVPDGSGGWWVASGNFGLASLDGRFLQLTNNLSELTTTASTARTNISAAALGSNSDITALNSLSGPVSGTSSATYSIYNTTDQTTNFERMRMSVGTNVFTLYTETGGTGTSREMRYGSTAAYMGFVAGAASGSAKFNIVLASNTSGSILALGSNGGQFTASANGQNGLVINPVINQSGTGAYTMLLINPSITATGSGAHNLIDAQVGGSSKFLVNDTGKIVATALQLSATTAGYVLTADATGNYTPQAPAGYSRVYAAISAGVTGGTTLNTDYTYKWTGSTAYTFTLPDATTIGRNDYTVKNLSTISQTVAPTSSQTIDGSTTAMIIVNQAVTFRSDGANWMVI